MGVCRDYVLKDGHARFVFISQAAMTSGGGGDDDDELDELEEEERARESQALAAKAELEERLQAVKPGDYQLQVGTVGTLDVKGYSWYVVVFRMCCRMSSVTASGKGQQIQSWG